MRETRPYRGTMHTTLAALVLACCLVALLLYGGYLLTIRLGVQGSLRGL